MNRSVILSAISFFVLLVFQVMLFKKLVLYNTAFCFIYIAFVLLLPVETNPLLLMLLAFILGLMIDVFYDHQGMHAAASVAIAYLRNYWLALITPQTGYEAGVSPTLSSFGFIWFITYVTPLIVLHHLILFFVDAGGAGFFGLTMAKVFASVLFTLFVLMLYQYFFYQRNRT